MTTLADLEDALANADRAGDTAAASSLADEIVRVRSQQPAPVIAPPPAQTPLARFDRFKQGLKDVKDGITQKVLQLSDALPQSRVSDQEIEYYANELGQSPNDVRAEVARLQSEGLSKPFAEEVNLRNAEYAARRGPDAGFDGYRLLGNVTATAPLALIPGGATTAARAKIGAATGGALGAIQFDPTNSRRGAATNITAGAGAGALLSPVAGYLGDKAGALATKVVQRARGAASTLTEQDVIAAVPEIQNLQGQARADLLAEAFESAQRTGTLNAEALARKANLLANDATPLKSMVTRNPQDWALERNLSKLTGPDPEIAAKAGELLDVYRANDQALAGRLGSLSDNLPPGNPEALGQNVMNAAKDVARSTQAEVSKLYDAVRATRGDELASDARRLYTVLDELADSPAADAVTTAARRRLTRLGMLDAQGQLTSKTLTVKQAEGLRQFINQQPNVYGKAQIIRAIDEDVLQGLGDDAFGGARGEAARRKELLFNPGTQKALDSLGELTEGKAAQNFIRTEIINGADQDVAALMNTLRTQPQAIESIRAGVLREIEDKVVNPNSGEFSGATLNKLLKRLGPEKLRIVFGDDQAGKLQSLARAGLDATYAPARSAVNNSNTTPAGLSLLRGARSVIGVPLPLVNDAAEKAIERQSISRQIADALAARAEAQPQLPDELRRRALAEALTRASRPATADAYRLARER